MCLPSSFSMQLCGYAVHVHTYACSFVRHIYQPMTAGGIPSAHTRGKATVPSNKHCADHSMHACCCWACRVPHASFVLCLYALLTGELSFMELANMIRSMGTYATSGDVEAMLWEIDIDNSHSIGFDEFVKFCTFAFFDPENLGEWFR